MNVEDKKVLCPVCDAEMSLSHGKEPFDNGTLGAESPYWGWYKCKCGWSSPIRYRKTEEEAIDTAYIAATRRPPNLHLTEEQIVGMDDLDAVWVVSWRTGAVIVTDARFIKQSYAFYNRSFIFSSNPTTEDIEAARKASP